MAIDMKLGDFFHEIKDIPSDTFDFVYADPPYFLSNGGFSVSSGAQVSVDKGAWDSGFSPKERSTFHNAWIKEIERVLKPNGTIVVSGTYHSIFQCVLALENIGFKILNEIIWFKPNGAPNLSRRRLTASHENLIWATRAENSKFTFNYSSLREGSFEGDKIKNAGKQMRSVWWIPSTPNREKTFGRHPTQKPLALMRRVILAFTSADDLVFDPFMGSGSTGVACKELGRNFFGIEQSEEFFEIARMRVGAQ
jgi:site-specific DNA-methyltransferase (adenine-specific)